MWTGFGHMCRKWLTTATKPELMRCPDGTFTSVSAGSKPDYDQFSWEVQFIKFGQAQYSRDMYPKGFHKGQRGGGVRQNVECIFSRYQKQQQKQGK